MCTFDVRGYETCSSYFCICCERATHTLPITFINFIFVLAHRYHNLNWTNVNSRKHEAKADIFHLSISNDRTRNEFVYCFLVCARWFHRNECASDNDIEHIPVTLNGRYKWWNSRQRRNCMLCVHKNKTCTMSEAYWGQTKKLINLKW